MGKSPRSGQVILEFLLMMVCFMALLIFFQIYQDKAKSKQRAYRWERNFHGNASS